MCLSCPALYFLQQPKALSRNTPASLLLLLLLVLVLVIRLLAFLLPVVLRLRMRVCVRMGVCICVCALSVCIRARVCEYLPLFTAAADAVYVGHLFPRLLSLKSIVFFLLLLFLLLLLLCSDFSFCSPCRVASVPVCAGVEAVCYTYAFVFPASLQVIVLKCKPDQLVVDLTILNTY